MSIKGTRAAIEMERKRMRAKVEPEIDAQWAEVEARHAGATATRNAQVEVHRERMQQMDTRRRQKAEAEEAAYQEILTADDESVLLMVGGKQSHRPGGSPESKEGQMPKLPTKKAAAAVKSAAPKAKAEKKGAFCLMTGAQTTGARFSGLGTDAKYKSLLVNTALDNPKGEVAIYDHETGEKSMKPAVAILKSLDWVKFLDKARESRKAKADATAKRAAETKAAAATKEAAGTAS